MKDMHSNTIFFIYLLHVFGIEIPLFIVVTYVKRHPTYIIRMYCTMFVRQSVSIIDKMYDRGYLF